MRAFKREAQGTGNFTRSDVCSANKAVCCQVRWWGGENGFCSIVLWPPHLPCGKYTPPTWNKYIKVSKLGLGSQECPASWSYAQRTGSTLVVIVIPVLVGIQVWVAERNGQQEEQVRAVMTRWFWRTEEGENVILALDSFPVSHSGLPWGLSRLPDFGFYKFHSHYLKNIPFLAYPNLNRILLLFATKWSLTPRNAKKH